MSDTHYALEIHGLSPAATGEESGYAPRWCRPDLKLSLAWTGKSSISLPPSTFEAVYDKGHGVVSFASVSDEVHDAGQNLHYSVNFVVNCPV